jgi:serine/threonine protein kinase
MTDIVDQADFSGFLRKRGGTVRGYRKRWFELRGKHLYYYKNQNTQNQQKPTGVILLTDASIEDNPKDKWGFKVKGAHLSRVYELQAENEAQMKLWKQELEKAIKYKPENDVEGLNQVRNEINDSKDKSLQIWGDSNGPKVSIEDFELLCVIGRGSFGKVMKVVHKKDNQIYAMKILKKDMIIKEAMVTHTLAEKNILQSLTHPFIVSLKYAFQTDVKLYLVLEFLAGGELFYHLKEETKFTPERAKFYIASITLAIEHLHAHNIVYRDLKPENIVLDNEGYAVLTDFGLAKTSVSNNTPTFTFCGTPEYLAPEILKGTGHGKSVDWWSLGILLYEMIVGLPPFYSENIKEMYELILAAPLNFPASVPMDAQNLLRGLLERDERKRLGSSVADGAEIRSHPFFKDIDWEKMMRKEMTPPFVPNVSNIRESTKYFDEEFTSERPVDSVCISTGNSSHKEDFADFNFSG